MINYTYSQILAMDDLSRFSAMETIGILGFIFEKSREERNLETLSKGLEFSRKMNAETFSNEEKTNYYYNISNGWEYKFQLRLSPNDIEFKNDELINSILNIRLALTFCDFPNSEFMRSQLLVNLGNTFSHLGRPSEAISLWENALECNPNFGMALGNLGFGVFHYGKVMPSNGYIVIFSQYAHKKLKEVLDSEDIYQEAKESFRNVIESIESVVGIKKINHKFNLENHSLGESSPEIEYREWSLDNKLFLNYLNDIYSLPIAGHDCMELASITMKIGEHPIFHDIFNQIKQEFISARYFVYTGLKADLPHFADRGNTIANTLDFSQYSINIETLKSGFRMCYSILDKIAVFINKYFDLEMPIHRVNFSKIWYIYDKQGKPKDLKEQIKNSDNWILRGLYWLSRDIYYDEVGTADPEAQDIAKIRNYIEHKSFKIGDVEKMEETNDGLTLVVNREYFEDKCLKTLKIVRAAIIYLSLAVHLSEEKKSFEGKVVPITLPPIDDDFKF